MSYFVKMFQLPTMSFCKQFSDIREYQTRLTTSRWNMNWKFDRDRIQLHVDFLQEYDSILRNKSQNSL